MALNRVLDRYVSVSGCKVNEKKATVLGLNITEGLKEKLRMLCKAEWRQKEVRYLGTRISDNPQDLLNDNIVSYVSKMRNQLAEMKDLGGAEWQ